MIRIPRSARRRLLAGVAVSALLLAACGSDTATDSDTADAAQASEDMADDMATDDMATDDMATDDMATDDMADDDMATDDMADHSEGMEDLTEAMDDAAEATPASGVVAITATTPDGTVSPADFAGQTVFVETFATWCSNCRRQLADTNEAASMAGGEAVFLALSVETNLDPAALPDYAAENGFDNITFGVLSAQDLATLEAEFGNSVLVPPSTPKFTVSPNGEVSDLTTGYESVDEILSQL